MKHKKLISMILTVVFIATTAVSAFAYPAVYKGLGYSNGIREWQLTDEYCTKATNAETSGGELTIKSGGEAEYFFYVPFHSVSMTINLRTENAKFSLYHVEADKTYDIEAEGTSHVLNFVPTLYIGENTFVIRADKGEDVEISKMMFNKIQIMISEHPYEKVNMSAEEWAVATAVILKDDSSMIMVNGSRRYIDFDNPTLTPRYINGSMCLPVKALARMLDCYYEDLPDKQYVLIRKMDREFLFAPDICYKQVFGQPRETIDNLVVYQDGYSWLPIRTISEYFGEYVGYKDGYVAMDDNRFHVNDILNEGSVHSFVANKFKPFIVNSNTDYTGRTYYVAQNAVNASDDNVGDITAPWKTLAHAGKVVRAGDTVIVKEGTYREILKVERDGEPGKPIRFVAAEGENVVISAAEVISDFMPYKDGIVAAPMNWDLGPTRNQVFYNGKTIREGRHPNGPDNEFTEQAGLSDNWPTAGDIHVYQPKDINHAYSDTVLNQEEEDYWKGGYLIGVWATAYSVQTTNIIASEKGKLTLEGGCLEAWGLIDNASNYNYSWAYITGHINTLDEPGEWVVRGNTLFIIPPEGETADSLTLEVKKRQLVIDLTDNKHVNIEGFTTIGGGAKLNNSEMCRIENCHIKYNNHFLYNMDPSGAYIDGGGRANPNGAPPRGEVGFFIGGIDNVITNCYFDEAAGAGLYITGRHAYVENNLVMNCGYGGTYIGGIAVEKVGYSGEYDPYFGNYIYQNTAGNSGRSVFISGHHHHEGNKIRTANVLPSSIAYNEFYGSMLASLDTGIVYTYMLDHGFDRLKEQMHNNICYNPYKGKDAFSFGIYHDGGTQNIDTYENIIFTGDESIKIGEPLHRAYAELALADCDLWNNVSGLVVPEGRDGLKPEDYPYNKPYDAGSSHGREPYLVNYELRHTDLTQKLDPNNLIVDKTDDYILAKDAKVGGDAYIDEKGMACFTKDGDWILFEDVDFGEASNVITVSYQADIYNLESEDLEIMIDSLDGFVYDMGGNIFTESRQSTVGDVRHRRLGIYSGVHDVYIRAKDHFASKITGIRVWTENLEASARMENLVWAGTFDLDEYKPVVEGFESKHREIKTTDMSEIIEGTKWITSNTYGGSVYAYKNVEIKDDADTFVLSTSSDEFYGGQLVSVHIGSPNAEPIAEVMTTSTKGWGTYVEDSVKLKEKLSAGTYDVYIKFTSTVINPGPAYDGKSCTFQYWSLYNASGSNNIVKQEE